MKERSFIGSLGILLYVVLSLIDRFFYKIPDYIYIPLMVLGIVIIIVGLLLIKRIIKSNTNLNLSTKSLSISGC